MIEDTTKNHAKEGEETHIHTHVLEDGTTIVHSHGEHGHHHSHAQTKAVLNRLSQGNRAPGIHQAHGGRRP